MPERVVVAEHGERREVVDALLGLVLDHRDLLEHDLALLLELAPGRRAEHVRHHVERDRQVVVEHARVDERRVLRGRRVQLGAELVEQLGDRGRVVPGAALEQHVLDEVREPALVAALVARAGVDPEADRDRAHALHVLGGHAQAARQRRHSMHQRHPIAGGRLGEGDDRPGDLVRALDHRQVPRSRQHQQRRRAAAPPRAAGRRSARSPRPARRTRRATGIVSRSIRSRSPACTIAVPAAPVERPRREPSASSDIVCSSSASGSATSRANARRRSAVAARQERRRDAGDLAAQPVQQRLAPGAAHRARRDQPGRRDERDRADVAPDVRARARSRCRRPSSGRRRRAAPTSSSSSAAPSRSATAGSGKMPPGSSGDRPKPGRSTAITRNRVREALADRAPGLPGGAEPVQAHQRRGRLVAREGDVEVGYPPLVKAASYGDVIAQVRGRCRRGPRSPPRSPPPPCGRSGRSPPPWPAFGNCSR